MTVPLLSQVDFSLMLPEILILLVSTVVISLEFIDPEVDKRLLAYITAGGVILTALVLIYFGMAEKSGQMFKGMFVLDFFAIFFKILILLTTILVVLSSLDYMEKVRFFKGEYYYFILLAALGMMFMSSAGDFLSLYIAVELSTFIFYILVTYLRGDAGSGEAGLKLFILGIFTSAILVYGISLIYGETGSIIFTEILEQRPPLSAALIAGMLLILVGLGFKIGAVPFHAWIPDVYEGAPTPITAYLSIAPKGAAFALLLRVFFSSFMIFKEEWVWLISWIAAVSMTYGNIVAIPQKNIKRLLAYSGIAQIGNILIGMAAASKMGGDSALFYFLTYLFANIGAFTIVIIFSNLTQSDLLEDYHGLSRRSPLLAFAMLVCVLSLAGVPPLAGFVAKLYIFLAAAREGLITLVVIALVNSIIGLYYYLLIVKRIYAFPARDQTQISLTPPLKAVVFVTVVGVLLLGVYPGPFIDFSVSAMGSFFQIFSAGR